MSGFEDAALSTAIDDGLFGSVIDAGAIDAGDAFGSYFTGDVSAYVNPDGIQYLTDSTGGLVIDGQGFAVQVGGNAGLDAINQQVGSFAGSSNWFTVNSFGQVVTDAATGVGDFFKGIGEGISNAFTSIKDSIGNALGLNTGLEAQGAQAIAAQDVYSGGATMPDFNPGDYPALTNAEIAANNQALAGFNDSTLNLPNAAINDYGTAYAGIASGGGLVRVAGGGLAPAAVSFSDVLRQAASNPVLIQGLNNIFPGSGSLLQASGALVSGGTGNISTAQIIRTGTQVATQLGLVPPQIGQAIISGTSIANRPVNVATPGIAGYTDPIKDLFTATPTATPGSTTVVVPGQSGLDAGLGVYTVSTPNNQPITEYSTRFSSTWDPDSGTWAVWDDTTGTKVDEGLSQAGAEAAANEYNLQASYTVQVAPSELQPNQTGNSPARYTSVYNPETEQWDVWDNNTGTVAAAGYTKASAETVASKWNIVESAQTTNTPVAVNENVDPQANPAFDGNGNLRPGYQYDAFGTPVWVGYPPNSGVSVSDVKNIASTIISQAVLNNLTGGQTQQLLANAGINPLLINSFLDSGGSASSIQSLINQARLAQNISAQRQNKAQTGDWRVRLRLAPNSNYLYNAANPGPVLWPLRQTDGVIFPYTPTIDSSYRADYDTYALTHSNYKGYFYKSSYIDAVNIKGTFTAQDTNEANYLLAVIHFFKSVTKMFYGQDPERGSPPPLVYLSGLGDFQYNEHPCVISQFNYNLPSDVNYIRAQGASGFGVNLLSERNRTTINTNPLSYALQRLATVGLQKGAIPQVINENTLGVGNPTYVPTKMDISLVLLPVQSRAQVSKQFSLANFANGNLLKGGFW